MIKRKHFLILLSVLLLPMCVYHKITHMEKGDLAWMESYHAGDTVMFSNGSLTDTLIVRGIKVHNSLNPINTNFNASSVYEAVAYLDYDIIHDNDTMEGWFSIRKEEQGQPVYLNFSLCDRYALKGIKPRFKNFIINQSSYDDCIVIDKSNSSLGKYQSKTCGVKSLIWSKSRGLLQYSFSNGDKYVRKDLNG